MINADLSSGKIKEILRARAQKLIKQEGLQLPKNEGTLVVEFKLAHERYAIEAAYIHEVYPLKDLTVLPNVPPHVKGVMNIRRQIIAVVNLKAFFDLPSQEITHLSKVIILKNVQAEFAVVVDEVIGVSKIMLEENPIVLATLTGIRQKFLKSITSDHIIVLDGEKLLSNNEIVVNQE